MKHCLSVVIFKNVFPYGNVTVGIQIVGTVNEFYKFNIGFKKYFQFLLNFFQALEANPFVYGRKAVGAAKGTAAGRFVVIYFVVGIKVPFLYFRICKWKLVKIFYGLLLTGKFYFAVSIPEINSFDRRIIFSAA